MAAFPLFTRRRSLTAAAILALAGIGPMAVRTEEASGNDTLEIRPFEGDPDPSPISANLAAAPRHRARLAGRRTGLRRAPSPYSPPMWKLFSSRYSSIP